MSDSDIVTKTRPVKEDTNMYGQQSINNRIIKSTSLVDKSRRQLCSYIESTRHSQCEKSSVEVELSEAKKCVEDLTLLIEKSNLGTKSLKRDDQTLEIDTKVEINRTFVKDLEAVEEELSRLKLDVESILREKIAAEKEVEKLRFKTKMDLCLLERLKKEIETANDEHLVAELGKIEALSECEEIERKRERGGEEVLDLLAKKKKRIDEMLGEAEKSKDMEKELFETVSDVEVLKEQLRLVKRMERRDNNSMSRSDRCFVSGQNYGLSVLKAKKEELSNVNAELFRLMEVMDSSRSQVDQAKKETARAERILRKYDVEIQKLNAKMLMAKTKLEVALSTKERVTSLSENLIGSLEKLKRNREASKREERLLKEEKTLAKAETLKAKLEIDENEKELITKLDELEEAKKREALALEKLESLIEKTMKRRETESEGCSTITISVFEYEYLSRHGFQAKETAEKKVVAAEAWIEALKASTKAVSMKIETLIRESGMVHGENPKAESYVSTKPARLSGKFKPVQRGKGRRYSSAGTPTFFVIKKKKKVVTLVKFFKVIK